MNDMPEGFKAVEVRMTNADIRKIGDGVFDAMNAAQERGYSLDQVIAATAYVLGSAIAQRGGVLLLDVPLKDALPLLSAGYLKVRAQLGN